MQTNGCWGILEKKAESVSRARRVEYVSRYVRADLGTSVPA